MKKILTKIGITFPPVKIVGIHSGLMIHCQNLTGGSQMKKILTKKGITFPPAKIVGIHSGLMIQCQNLAGGSQMKKNIDQNREPPLFWSIYFPPITILVKALIPSRGSQCLKSTEGGARARY